MMKVNKIPSKIDPDPIITAVIEVRFKTAIPESTVVGVIYGKLIVDYPNFKNLLVPFEMKQVIPQFKYSAESEISNNDYIIGIGRNVFSQKITNNYLGWNDFFSTFKNNFKKLIEIPKLIDSIERIGLRYINFFKNETSMFNSFKLNIDFSEKKLYSVEQTMFSTTLLVDDIKLNLKVQDKASTPQSKEGLLVDIDAYYLVNEEKETKKWVNIVETLHKEEKKLFFNLLKDEFLNKFNPQYEET